MPKPKTTTHFLVSVTHDVGMKDLVDHVAGRVYCMDGVSMADACALDPAVIAQVHSDALKSLLQKAELKTGK